MWHASICKRDMPFGRVTLENIARRQLDGVGDASLGEWLEFTGRFLHLRRRLSVAEQVSVGPAVDIRADMAEVERRLRPVRHVIGPDWKE